MKSLKRIAISAFLILSMLTISSAAAMAMEVPHFAQYAWQEEGGDGYFIFSTFNNDVTMVYPTESGEETMIASGQYTIKEVNGKKEITMFFHAPSDSDPNGGMSIRGYFISDDELRTEETWTYYDGKWIKEDVPAGIFRKKSAMLK